MSGVIDCTDMTLTSEVNDATEGADPGTLVWLGAHGSGNEMLIDETLILRPHLRYEGCGGLERGTRLKAHPDLPTGTPLVAAEGYLLNRTLCDNPTALVGVDIDGDGKAGCHGVVIYNFRALVQNVQVQNIAGTGDVDSAAAFYITDRGVDGSTVTTNSHSENRFIDIRAGSLSGGATAFLQMHYQNPGVTGGSNMDGHLLGAFFYGGEGSGRAIHMQRAAGWTIRDIHTYGQGEDAMRLFNCYGTLVSGVYIEGYGRNDTPGTNYAGLRAEFLSIRGSSFSDIKVSSNQPDSPAAGAFRNYHLVAGSGQTRAYVSLTGCHSNINAGSAPATTKSQAWRFGESGHSGRMLYVDMAGCTTDVLPGAWINPAEYVHATTVTLRKNAQLDNGRLLTAQMPVTTSTVRAVTGSSTTTINPTTDGNIVTVNAGSNITSLNVSTTGAVDGQVIRVRVVASAGINVTVAAAVRTSTGLTRGPYAVASGQAWICAVEYVAALAAWVLTAATVTAS